MGRHSIGWTFALLSMVAACSGDDDGSVPACVGDKSSCGQVCSSLKPCPLGTHCGITGTCERHCNATSPCPGGGACMSNGMCVAGPDSGTAGRAGTNATPTSGRGGTAAGTGGRAGATPMRPNNCADSVVQTTRVTPTVVLIVDQSSSMEEDFDDGTRWDVLRDFLLESPNGLIADLQSQVNFGLALYSAVSGGTSPTPLGECPMVATVAPAANNFDAIAAVYSDAEPIEDTPTGDSIDRVLESFGYTDPDATRDPVVFVLATDGEPDRCEELDPQNGQEEALAAVRRAYQSRIRTYVISVGDEIGEQHQQDIANAGLGRGPGDPDAEYWRAGDDQTLRAALTEIVGGQLGCEIQLNGRVPEGMACRGTVELNGDPLGCDDPNGWELLDEQHIRLLGTACDELKASDDVYLDVSFPCGVVGPG